MSSPFDAAPDPAADARWLAWKAHGVESDRRSAVAVRWLFAAVVTVVVGWLSVRAL